jgi:hypothetical protein
MNDFGLVAYCSPVDLSSLATITNATVFALGTVQGGKVGNATTILENQPLMKSTQGSEFLPQVFITGDESLS